MNKVLGLSTNARRAALLMIGAMVLVAGCGRREPPIVRTPPTPPVKENPVQVATPPPATTTPTAQTPVIDSFTADPTRMERGQSATLRWAVRNATEVTIDQGLGAVQPSGSRQVFPSASMTYTLTARSAAGEVSRSVTVEVVNAPPPPQAPKVDDRTVITFMSQLRDVNFAYDSSDISSDGQQILRNNAQLLNDMFRLFPTANVVIEGHCDERGSSEYNLALGDRRAISVRQALVSLGVSSDRMRTLSYGEERPLCTDTGEACWGQNRRAHFAAGQ